MTAPFGQGSRRRGALLIADISGYTRFLQGVADAHREIVLDTDEPPAAFGFVSSLLDAIVEVVAPPFGLVKFEGDAVFAAGTDEELGICGEDVLACLRACHEAFRRRLATAREQWTCECGSCSRINALDLKFVLHHGDFVVQPIAGREELLGADVNVAHRLLKNHAVDLIGARPYALLTDAALVALQVPSEGMVAAEERYEAMPPVPVHVLALA